jgi:hypothetical protein
MNPVTDLTLIPTNEGADLVPPSLDRAREFARHSKAESTLRDTARTGETSARGANETVSGPFQRRLKP